MNRFLLLTALWLAPAFAHAQEPAPGWVAQRIGAADGLPGASVSDVALDADGFLWVATFNEGLLRFDGERFIALKEREHPGLPGNQILQLFRLGNGDLWLRTGNGRVARFNGGDFDLPLAAGMPEPMPVRAARMEGRAELWLATPSRLLRIRRAAVEPFCELPRGVELLDFHVETGGTAATADIATRDDGLWRCTRGRAVPSREDAARQHARFDVMARVAAGPRQPPPRQDGQGHQWTSGWDTLLRDGMAVWQAPGPISGFVPDGEDGVFAIVNGHGLYRIAPRRMQVFGHAAGLADTNVYAMAPEDAEGRVAQAASLLGWRYRIDARAMPPRVQAWRTRVSSMWSLWVDAQGAVWEGGGFLCVVRGDACDEAMVPPELHQRPGFDANVRMIFRDARGRLWAGSDAGLFLRASETGPWRRIEDAPPQVLRVGLDLPDGGVLFGGNGSGLWRWDGTRLRKVAGASSEIIRSLHLGADGLLYIGSENRGLLRGRLGANGRFMQTDAWDLGSGFPDDAIHAILPDTTGRLWLNSNRGLFWFRPPPASGAASGTDAGPQVALFDERDGLIEREGNGGVHSAGFRAADGVLWFASQGGVLRVDPADIGESPPPRPPRLERADAGFGALPARIEFAPDAARTLRLRVTSPRFSHPERLRFRYRLAGLDAGFAPVGASREIVLERLPPGEWTLDVEVSDAGGPWLAAREPLRLGVQPKFVETRGFRALLAALAALAVFAAWRLRTHQLHQRTAELQRQVDARTREVREEKRKVEDTLAVVEQQRRALQTLDAAKSRFFAELSHELRTPLTLILGPAERALSDTAAPADAGGRETLASIRGNAERLLALVNQILALAQLEAGTYRLQPGRGSLLEHVRATASLFAPLARTRGVRLDMPEAVDGWAAEFDPDAIATILCNLLANALRHTPEGRAVRVELQAVTDGVVLSVIDEGPGIAPERARRVFDRYFSDQPGNAGSGIGLALARELARAHGGDLDLTPNPGGGCVFRCVLPLAVERGAPAAERAPVATDPPVAAQATNPDEAEDRPRVLVVEDEADVRRFIAACLAPEFEVRQAGDGVQALRLAREALPDLVVSDIEMPQLDGLALLRALENEPELRGVPVVLLTAHGGVQAQLEGLRAGAVDYLTKPFSPLLLAARVRRLLGFRQRLREALALERTLAPESSPQADAGQAQAFQARLEQHVHRHLGDAGFGVDALAAALNMSRATLHRRCQEHGLPAPAQCIRDLRMAEAAELLRAGRGSVAEVAYAVGYNSQSHFARRFREHHGVAPTEYVAQDPAT